MSQIEYIKKLPLQLKLLFSTLISYAVFELVLLFRHSASPVGNDLIIVRLILWTAIFWLLWGKRNKIALNSGFIFGLIGLLILQFVLFKSATLFWYEAAFSRLLLALGIFGITLLAFNFRTWVILWREAILLCLLVSLAYQNRIVQFMNIEDAFSILTAKTVAFIFHYIGYEVGSFGNVIKLSHGTVNVLNPCTGMPIITLLLCLVFMLEIMLPLKLSERIKLPIVAILCGFIMGCIRVAILALVVDDYDKFHYWHGDSGNQIFSTTSILVFGYFSKFLIDYFVKDIPIVEVKNDFKPIRKFHNKIFMFVGIGSIISTIIIGGLFFKTGNRNVSKTLSKEIYLPGYNLVKVDIPMENPVLYWDTPYQEILNHGLYTYQNETNKIDVEIYYIAGLFHDIYDLLNDSKMTERAANSNGEIWLNIQKSPNTGTVALFYVKDIAYLTTLIHPRGPSSTYEGTDWKAYDLSPRRFINWLKGSESLRDRRFYWIISSTAIEKNTVNKDDSSKVDDENIKKAYNMLLNSYLRLKPRWQSKFPKHLSD